MFRVNTDIFVVVSRGPCFLAISDAPHNAHLVRPKARQIRAPCYHHRFRLEWFEARFSWNRHVLYAVIPANAQQARRRRDSVKERSYSLQRVCGIFGFVDTPLSRLLPKLTMKDSEQKLTESVNIEAVMQEIRQQVLERKLPSQVNIPINGKHLPPEFYEYLYRAILAQNQLGIKMQVTKSTVPVVGGIIDRFRAMFHQLVIFYIQRLTEQQAEVNRNLLQALSALSQYFEDQAEG